MKLDDAERGFRGLLLAPEEQLISGPDPVRQRLYRRLVRNNLFGAVRRAVPISRKLLSDDVVDALISRWLDEQGPSTRLVRQVAGEFAAWLMAREDLPHAAAGELAHWEALEIDVGLAPEHEGASHPRAPAPASTVETHPSTRIVAYRHAVHRLTKSAHRYPEPSPEPIILLAWRASERFVWQRLEGGTAKVLVQTAEGATLGDAFAAVEASLAPGDTLDRPRVNAALVDLCRRGAVVGFPGASS